MFFSKNISSSLNKTKESLNCSDSQNSPEYKNNSYSKTPFLIQDEKLDSFLNRINNAFDKNEVHIIGYFIKYYLIIYIIYFIKFI